MKRKVRIQHYLYLLKDFPKWPLLAWLLLGLYPLSGVRANTSPIPQTVPQLIAAIERMMEEEKIPGMMISIVSRDSVIWEGGLGLSNIARREPVTVEHIFRQGDISKTIGALAILKLVERGRFSLDDELRLLAPEINFSNDYELTHPVRVMHLLEHTSGFDDVHLHARYNYSLEGPKGRKLIEIHENSFKSRWLPGDRFAYSDAGYALLTYLIEKFSQMPYQQFITQELLSPLGMEHSNFSSFPTKEEIFTTGYQWKEGQYVPTPFWAVKAGVADSFNSCAEDMSQLLKMFLNNGMVDGRPLFTPEQLTRMENPKSGVTARNKMEVGYGLGNFTLHLEAPVIFHGHTGEIDGFRSQYAYNRELGVGYALANNSLTPNNRIALLIADFLIEKFPIRRSEPIAIDSAAVAPFLGYYDKKNPESELFHIIPVMFGGKRLSFAGDRLLLEDMTGQVDTIYQVDEMLFAREGEAIGSIKLAKGESQKLIMADGFEDYYEKSSMVRPWIFRLMIFGSSSLMVLMMLCGLVWVALYYRNSLSKVDFYTRMMPFLASLTFVLGAWIVLYNLQDLFEASTFNWKTILVFVSSLLFAAFSYLGLWLIARYFRKVRSPWIATLLLLTNLFFASLVSYMSSHGMIGLMLWAY